MSARAIPASDGVFRDEIGPAARLIGLVEELGWVHDVRRPAPLRLAAEHHDGSPGVPGRPVH